MISQRFITHQQNIWRAAYNARLWLKVGVGILLCGGLGLMLPSAIDWVPPLMKPDIPPPPVQTADTTDLAALFTIHFLSQLNWQRRWVSGRKFLRNTPVNNSSFMTGMSMSCMKSSISAALICKRKRWPQSGLESKRTLRDGLSKPG